MITAIVLITIFSENGEFRWSLITLACCAAIIYFINKSLIVSDLKDLIVNNVGYIIAGSILYVGIGLVWAIIKWKWFATWWYERYEHSIMSIDDNKARITGWMLWWPMSMGWFLIHDPITRFYNFLYKKLRSTFVNISNSARETVKAKAK